MRNQSPQFQMNMPMTSVVKTLIIINVIIWFGFQILLESLGGIRFTPFFALYPGHVIYDFFLWQPLTYMFLHSAEWTHIVFNMLMLWWIGAELELRWGPKFFLQYYLGTGIGAAIFYSLGSWIYAQLTGNSTALTVPVIGASGAIFGLMLAYGIIYGERIVYFMMIFPMKAKFFVLILGFIQLVSLLTSGIVGGGVAYLAHLTGLLSGFIILRSIAMYKQIVAAREANKRGRNLKLVVNNKNEAENEQDPKYWN